MRSKGILTMGTAFPRVPPRNDHWARRRLTSLIEANALTTTPLSGWRVPPALIWPNHRHCLDMRKGKKEG